MSAIVLNNKDTHQEKSIDQRNDPPSSSTILYQVVHTDSEGNIRQKRGNHLENSFFGIRESILASNLGELFENRDVDLRDGHEKGRR